ncbi:neuropeptide S receptor isoform X2 [Mustela putorius furo]|uniref:Neuropeptide S receptor isoform X2 n=1 Tax=Mustela putorius furo TaxID=9669 RepID=A0A8U0VBB1_MUSPF|nr:neuropeptide S receptor isoform X2 [Mustela putorius furo]
MTANLTEGIPDSSGTTQTLDASPVFCTETVTFTEVVEAEEWGSFYYSFKTEQLITLWVLFVFTIVGNSMVLFSTWRRKRKSRMTFFVTQLAITEKQAKILIMIAWSLSFLFSIPTLIIFGKRKLSNGEVQCWALWPDDSYWTPYMTIVAFLVYFIPLAIISVIYAIVIRTIWMKSKAHETVISNCSDGKLCTSYHRGLLSKAKIKAIKYSIVIILAFICCWSPYFFFDILDNFSLLPDTEERFYASVIIQNLPALNSAINPLIYCVFSSSICCPCRERTSRDSRMTFRERTQRHEMQILPKPEFI